MSAPTHTYPLKGPLPHGTHLPRIALIGHDGSGRISVFRAAASTAIRHERLAGIGPAYEECRVEVGGKPMSLVHLPVISGLHRHEDDATVILKYLLWGDHWPAIARHERHQPDKAFAAPDVLLFVMDATALERDLELALELAQIGKPMVIALNRMDDARARRLLINVPALAEKLGMPVIPTVAHMGLGLAELFAAAVEAAHRGRAPLPQPPSPHIAAHLHGIAAIANAPEVAEAFAVPPMLLTLQLAETTDYFFEELRVHFPGYFAALMAERGKAAALLPRPLSEEIHADRHYQAALVFEAATRPGRGEAATSWRHLADRFFLHPRWGILGSLSIFALVLSVVFEVSAMLDALTVHRFKAWVAPWQPTDTVGVVLRAVLDGGIGLADIVIPYMLPLLLLLAFLERSGIMHRVAFVVDRDFHRLGLHGGVALPFLIGLGCNVPALAATAAVTRGRDRAVASMLITFLPCSARSAILLAIGGKYLGSGGVIALFLLAPLVVGIAGKLLRYRYPETAPGMIQSIPPYTLPSLRVLLADTWGRSRDIITIVLPLLLAGSVVLGLLTHVGADRLLNLVLAPITAGWLGLPVVLGVPILFGILRKELTLLMMFQALGSQEIDLHLNSIQIATFLTFMTFYVPCLSTFAMMLKLLGHRDALFSLLFSFGMALAVAALVRWPLELANLIFV